MDYHILTQADDLKTIEVVFHFPVPAANNQAGISYQQALVNYLGGSTKITSQLYDIDAGELTQMQAGAVYEHVVTMRFSSAIGLSNAEKLAQIQTFYNSEKARLTAELQVKLSFFGYSGNAA